MPKLVFAHVIFILVLCLVVYNTCSGVYRRKFQSSVEIQNGVPKRILQYGIGGTATTLQFQILCVLMAIIHATEIDSFGCYYSKQPSHPYAVIKTHFIRDFVLQSPPLHSWVFMTFSDSLTEEKIKRFELDKRTFENMKFNIKYIADVDLVSKRGYLIAYEYQSIFNVSDAQMEHALEYLRYWDILRLCCGKQMSADWRRHLSPPKHYTPHHDPHGPLYPACEMYNITEVESLMMKTYIYKKFAHIPSIHDVIGKPSTVDGAMDGQYCERCNKNISTKHLGFNENCA